MQTPQEIIESTMCYLMDRGISPTELVKLLQETIKKLK